MFSVSLEGAKVLTPDGVQQTSVHLAQGRIVAEKQARAVDLSGFTVLPGIVDPHGDGFERHVAPRRGAMKDIAQGLQAAEAEMAANGVTTGVVAQFISWEGGVRGFDFADRVFSAMRQLTPRTTMIPQARFETHLLDLYETLPAHLVDWGVPYVVFNDHLQHERLAEGRRPKQLTGQALKAGRSPEKHFEHLLALEARTAEVPKALDALCATLRDLGIRMGSHDDATCAARSSWQDRGVHIAEFPETLEAAEAPGDVIMGAPNLMRGGSHKGNISALDVVLMECCDALASDYHYPSLRGAALFLAKTIGLEAAWKLISEGPARILGLTDRGRLEPGLRADIVVLDEAQHIAATLSGGIVTYMAGEIADRLLSAQITNRA